MARARLTPEEKEARRKAAWARIASGEAYKKYDPRVEGYGNSEEYRATARARMEQPDTSADMNVLGLARMPSHLEGLKKAFRAAVMKAHPDHGGSDQALNTVVEAFERLKKEYPDGRA